MKCLLQPKDQRTQIMLGDNNEFGFQCSHEAKQLNNISQEVFSRIFKPLYFPLLAIISSLLLIKSKNSIGYSRYKIIIFVTGVLLISFSEILTKFFSYNFNKSFLLMIFPILVSLIFYLLFYKQSLTLKMIFKVYQNYISKQFLLTFVKTVFIFFTLAFILNIFEEINFFKDLDVSFGLPVFLTFLTFHQFYLKYFLSYF